MRPLFPVLLDLSGIAPKEAAEMFDKHLSTIKAYSSGRIKTPRYIYVFLMDTIRAQNDIADKLALSYDGLEVSIQDIYDSVEEHYNEWPSTKSIEQCVGLVVAMINPGHIDDKGIRPDEAKSAGGTFHPPRVPMPTK